MKETQHGCTCGIDRNFTCWRIFSVLLMFLYTVTECAETDCGQTYLQRSSGNITSPNYPRNYPDDAACKWHISLASTEIITVRFISFNTIATKNCNIGGKLTIDVGDIEVPYCGSTLPDPYISVPGPTQAIIKFTSTTMVSSSGFMIEYFKGESSTSSCPRNQFRCGVGNCIPQWWVCDDMYECSDNSDEANCINVHTTPSLQCPSHTFLCHQLSDNMQACLPESLKCDGHQDCVNNDDETACQSVCNHVLKGTNGNFESPNFPDGYDPNLDCLWLLTVDEGAIIQLRFYEFDLETKVNTDYVKVYDGLEATQDNYIDTYYGAKGVKDNKDTHIPPTVIEGTGNTLRVSLVTDAKVSASGFNATYQIKGRCLEGQTSCGPGDNNCYDDKLERCDNHLTCMRGQDELNCHASCGKDRIFCFETLKGCFTQEQRCNGKQDCIKGEDEKDCDSSLCNSRAGLFRCGDGICIEERFTCNSASDCKNGDDEENCYPSTNVVTAAAVGSIVCGLLLVAALSCTCKLYQLHVRERLPPSHMSPLREIEEELLRREAPPSYTATMASPHFDEAQRAFIEGIQAAVIARNESRGPSRSSGSGRRQRSTFVRMLSRDRPRSGSGSGDQQQIEQEDSTTPSQSETLPPSPDGEPTTPPEEITVGDNTPPPLRRISGELSCPTVSPSPAEAIPQSSGAQERESASSSVSDTDSETNQDALHLATRDQQILRAAANIRRMRLAGGLQNVLQAQDHRAARARSRTGSLVDTASTNSEPENDPGTPTSERGPELVAEAGSPNENTNNRTDTTDEGLTTEEGLTSETPQDTTDESPESSAAQAKDRSTPTSDRAQSPSGDATPDDKIDTEEEEAVDKDSNEERLSQASSILSLQSCSSEHTADDVPLLNPE
ncbi:low-density lipoprotein receptor-related protein 12-like isoform X2 [Patiria miniata]|nr:low-density lipoprotein receptor-related protein 12-like isoform X2 [Patiria miniata]